LDTGKSPGRKSKKEELEIEELRIAYLIKNSINKESYCKLESSLIKVPE